MKKLFMTIALMSAAVFGAHAQKSIDLEILPIEAGYTDIGEPGGTYDNLATGDTFYVGFVIKNNGPEDVVETDTLYCTFSGPFIGETSGESYELTGSWDGFSIASGEMDTVFLRTIQNTVMTEGSEESIYTRWNVDNLDTVIYAVRGSAAGTAYSDEGVNPDLTYPTDGSSNNLIAYTFEFGEPSSISVASLTSNIQVYPNPAASEINFAYNFEKASNASGKILDITGKVIYTKEFGMQSSGQHNFTLPVADLPNGNYTLEFVTESNRGVSKFTVTR